MCAPACPRSPSLPLPATTPTVTPIESSEFNWSWEMLFWLLPLGLLLWGVVALIGGWRRRRQDPWLALLTWGRKAGRPMDVDETTAEYGRGLADMWLPTGGWSRERGAMWPGRSAPQWRRDRGAVRAGASA
ncbi:MAG: hypothetical protein R2838_14975 [Caldilineaceae bacterium]